MYFCAIFFKMKKYAIIILLSTVLQILSAQVAMIGLPCKEASSVKDHEGNIYRTVQLGSQCWMAENMHCRTSPTGKTWVHNPVFSVYNPVFKSYYITVKNSTYGNLYNWSAAMDLNINEYAYYNSNDKRRGICPLGWHLPSYQEWSSLLESLGGTRKAGAVMKSATTLWIDPVIADEVSGFEALPAGVYTEDGLKHTGNYAHYWSSTTYDRQNAWCCGIFSYNKDSYNILDYKCYGRSVRCIKD